MYGSTCFEIMFKMGILRTNLVSINSKLRWASTLKCVGVGATRKLHIPHFSFPLIQMQTRVPFLPRISTRCNTFRRLWDQNPIILRDACVCSMCVDPHSGQKNFKTSDIPVNIKAESMNLKEDGLHVKWINEIPGFQSHESVIPLDFIYAVPYTLSNTSQDAPRSWDCRTMQQLLPTLRFDYSQYINQSKTFHKVIKSIRKWGLVFLNGVPKSEEAVEKIASRIGPLRNTFYGKTWDVVSVNEAKNVAYTDKYLGLHQDLLYMENPPGIQFLHCLKNNCKGGESLFCDAFRVAEQLSSSDYDVLSKEKIGYHYEKAGESYQRSHPVLEIDPKDQSNAIGRPLPLFVNYSPPFQAPFALNFRSSTFTKFVQSLGRFAQGVESVENVFKYKLLPGECVIFNNRRVLHGRECFEAQANERWLKGCYLDSDVFLSCLRYIQMAEIHLRHENLNNLDSKDASSQSNVT